MKLLRLIHSLNPVGGGPVEGIRQITPHLSSLGVSTSVACLDTPHAHWLDDQTFNAIPLGPAFSGYGYRRDLPRLIRTLSQQHDAVIIHGLWQYHSLATWRALRSSTIPYFVYPHGMLDPWFKRTYPIKHLKKSLYWPFSDYLVLRDASAVLFTTEQEKFLARQSFSLYEANEIVVGYGTSNPPGNIENQLSAFYRQFPHLKNYRLLLFLSRIHPKKGIDLLIQAFSYVSQIDSSLHLVIAGPDQSCFQPVLKRLAESLGIADRITWTGMLTGDSKWGAYRCAELFCLPSHQENFGIVVSEALACGLPVSISSSVNTSAEVALAGAGIVHSDCVHGTTNALRTWLSMTSADKAVMSDRAARLFAKQYNFSSVANNLFDILNKTL